MVVYIEVPLRVHRTVPVKDLMILLMDKILHYPLFGIYHNSHSLESLRSCRILSISSKDSMQSSMVSRLGFRAYGLEGFEQNNTWFRIFLYEVAAASAWAAAAASKRRLAVLLLLLLHCWQHLHLQLRHLPVTLLLLQQQAKNLF